jgi:hypothetical protein
MNNLFDLLGSIAIVFTISFLASVLIPVGLAYIALRMRDSRAKVPDPKLGLKTALHLVHSIAILMLLTGSSISAADMMQGALGGNKRNAAQPIGRGQAPLAPAADEFWNTSQRSAAALAGSGALFAILFWVLLRTTNDRKFLAVRRTFVGGRLAIALLIVFFAVTGITLTIVQKDIKVEPVELMAGALMVWMPAAAIHMYLLHQAMKMPLEPLSVRAEAIEDD